MDSKSASLAARTPIARPEKSVTDNSNALKAKVLNAVRLDVTASAEHRDQMLGELNDLVSEDEAAKWARRRLSEKNKLNAGDAKHIEEAFRTKLLTFVTCETETLPVSNSKAPRSSTIEGRGKKAAVDKFVLVHPEPRRTRDRNHVRFVAQQTCLVCGRRPCDAHHLRFAQSRALARKVSDEFTDAVAIIANCTATGKPCGGINSGSTPMRLPERCGLKLIRQGRSRAPAFSCELRTRVRGVITRPGIVQSSSGSSALAAIPLSAPTPQSRIGSVSAK